MPSVSCTLRASFSYQLHPSPSELGACRHCYLLWPCPIEGDDNSQHYRHVLENEWQPSTDCRLSDGKQLPPKIHGYVQCDADPQVLPSVNQPSEYDSSGSEQKEQPGHFLPSLALFDMA